MLAICVGSNTERVNASTDPVWAAGQQIKYRLWSQNPLEDNVSTFTIVDINQTSGQVNASRDARLKEDFPFLFTVEAITSLMSSPTNNGTPAFGTATYSAKNVMWINKTNVLGIDQLNTSYLAYQVNPAHIYSYVIDTQTGIMVHLVDVTTGRTLLTLIQWPDQIFNWSTLFSVLAATGAFFLFYGFFRYGTRELRIAPRKTQWDRIRINLSAFMFAIVLTGVVIFIATVVLTAIGENWTVALQIGVPQESTSATYYRPLEPPWIVEISFVQALKWPNFIAITSILIGVYLCIYPFFDIMSLSQRGADAPMEFQQTLNTYFISKAPGRLNILAAAAVLFGAYILPTYALYAWFSQNVIGFQGILDMALLLTIIAWFSIPALFLLDYYASFGVSSVFWTTLRRGFRARSKMQNTLNRIVFVISTLLLISVAYNFIDVVVDMINAAITNDPLNMLPNIVGVNSSNSQFLIQIIHFFISLNIFGSNTANIQWQFDELMRIFPFDLLFFLVAVCVVGLYGFYSKFLSKEPLNRPALMLFASYIMATVGVNVFLNVILKIPNAFPDGFLLPAFTNPNGYTYGTNEYISAFSHHYDSLRLLFFIPYFLDRVFTFTMVMNNLLNKRLRDNISERNLAFAVRKDRLDILSKYTISTNPRTQRVVLENAYRILKKSPGEASQIIKIVERFITSEDPTINALANKVLLSLAANIQIQDLEPALLSAIKYPAALVRDAIAETLTQINNDAPIKVRQLFTDIITSELPDTSLEFLANLLKQFRSTQANLPWDTLAPLLDTSANDVRAGTLKILKIFNVLNLKDNLSELLPKLTRIIEDKNESQALDAIEILGTIGASNPAKMDTIIAHLEEIRGKASAPVKKRIVHAETTFIVAAPTRANEIFPKLYAFLGDLSPEVRREVAVGVSITSRLFATTDTFDLIQKTLEKLLSDFDEGVRGEAIKVIGVTYRANPILLRQDSDFAALIEKSIKDPAETVRDKVVDLFVEMASNLPSMAIFTFPLKILENPESPESRLTALRILKKIVTSYPRDGGINLILNPVMAIERKSEGIRYEVAGILLGIAQTRSETAGQIYPVLRDLAKDPSEIVAASAIQALGEIALAKIGNRTLAPNVPLHEILDLVINQCSNRKAQALVAAIKSISIIYTQQKDLHAELYPIILKMRYIGITEVLLTAVPLLTDIVCDHKEDYTGQHSIDELLHAFLEIIRGSAPEVHTAVSAALNKIVTSFPETAFEVDNSLRPLAVQGKGQGEEVRVAALTALGRFPGAINDEMVAQVLVRATRAWRSPLTRRTAFEGIQSVFAGFPLKDLTPAQQKCQDILTTPFSRWQFLLLRLDRSRDVRKAYEDALVTAGNMQKKLATSVFSNLSRMALDKDAEISLAATKGLFDIVRQYPDTVEIATKYLPRIANSRHMNTRSILQEEVKEIVEKTGNLTHLLPIILTLAGDDNLMISRAASQDFQSLAVKRAADIKTIREVLVVMTYFQNYRTRAGAVREIPPFLTSHPEEESFSETLLTHYFGLGRDPDRFVRQQVAVYLLDAIKLAPPTLVNVVFQTLFRLIREDDRVTKNLVADAIRALATKYPERIPEVISDLKRLNRKEQVVTLDDLIREFRSSQKYKRTRIRDQKRDRDRDETRT